jgi:hypothetical protein
MIISQSSVASLGISSYCRWAMLQEQEDIEERLVNVTRESAESIIIYCTVQRQDDDRLFNHIKKLGFLLSLFYLFNFGKNEKDLKTDA